MYRLIDYRNKYYNDEKFQRIKERQNWLLSSPENSQLYHDYLVSELVSLKDREAECNLLGISNREIEADDGFIYELYPDNHLNLKSVDLCAYSYQLTPEALTSAICVADAVYGGDIELPNGDLPLLPPEGLEHDISIEHIHFPLLQMIDSLSGLDKWSHLTQITAEDRALEAAIKEIYREIETNKVLYPEYFNLPDPSNTVSPSPTPSISIPTFKPTRRRRKTE